MAKYGLKEQIVDLKAEINLLTERLSSYEERITNLKAMLSIAEDNERKWKREYFNMLTELDRRKPNE